MLHRASAIDQELLTADPARLALFLDIDGTLLNIAPLPDAVVVPPDLVGLLGRLAGLLGGAVAILTGRPIADADRLLAPLKLVSSGVHGTEVRSEQGGEVRQLSQTMPAGLTAAIRALGESMPGVLVEEKGPAAALHYRNAPEAREAIVTGLERIVGWSSYYVSIRHGRMVVEVVPSAFSKGTVLTMLAELPPFKGRIPIMIGDDTGDEPALDVARRLGGTGLRVAGEHFPAGASHFDGADSVRHWLAELADKLEAKARA